ncbi:CRISPR-associated exonuclease Cas4 [Cyclobacterium lianum]|uniref:CRISPR-associated exonuclease Cas4 n=1 Tax=Cyclobacterium lianum TaxID=388280 RepID=A0A1M7NKK6_9BACT|nr:CRISPR-associated protein Cas4 [Cyclobacterium lianum]SHN04375.1 CRISPR-associated exonuclease Cas4 [Cyclobacterium lianum]
MNITGTHIAYLHTCHRKLWLFANGIQMEHTSDIVAEGKLIGETSYLDRARKYTELELDGIKIDFYDAKNRVIHEVKKTDKVEQAHIAQVKYYLYVLQKNGISDASGLIEYPKMRQTQIVEWEEGDQSLMQGWVQEVKDLISQKNCPPLEKKSICRSCSYFDFCYATESVGNELI